VSPAELMKKDEGGCLNNVLTNIKSDQCEGVRLWRSPRSGYECSRRTQYLDRNVTQLRWCLGFFFLVRRLGRVAAQAALESKKDDALEAPHLVPALFLVEHVNHGLVHNALAAQHAHLALQLTKLALQLTKQGPSTRMVLAHRWNTAARGRELGVLALSAGCSVRASASRR
jgi:hypothetical protein